MEVDVAGLDRVIDRDESPDRSVVDVHAEWLADSRFMVRVGNRGRIIPPEVLPTLFRKYRQEMNP